jgi:TPR repeat protein
MAAPAATPADGHNMAAPAATPADEHSLAPTAPRHEPDVAAPSAGPGLATPAKAPHAETAAPLPAAGARLSAEDMGALLARGDTLLSVGDVVSARLFYERAVDAGGGLAAIRLGETFDPLFLDRVRLRGVRGDPGAAVFWYRRARDLGASDAEVLLEALKAK